MRARQFAALMDSREVKRGKLWKAKCPAHNGKKRSLQISDGKTGVLLTCWTHHCTVKEICGALGVKVSDLFESRPPRTKAEKAAFRKAQAERERERVEEERSRYRHQFFTMRRDGYTVEDMAKDWEVCIAMAQQMAIKGEQPHLERMLEWHGHRVLIGSTVFGLNPWKEK